MIYHRTFSLAVSKVKQSNSKAEDVLYSQRNEVRDVFFFLLLARPSAVNPNYGRKYHPKKPFAFFEKFAVLIISL